MWSDDDAAAFEARLLRARPSNRAQYLRIQATHLVEAADAGTREAGRGLLRRVFDEYPGDSVVGAKPASEQLGSSLADEGLWPEAEVALRHCLDLCATSTTGTSGTSGVPALRLAEVLLDSDQPRHQEVLDLLRQVEADAMTTPLRAITFRFTRARARAWGRLRDPRAQAAAQWALDLLADTSNPFPRHPSVGLPHASAGAVAELRDIAEPDPA